MEFRRYDRWYDGVSFPIEVLSPTESYVANDILDGYKSKSYPVERNSRSISRNMQTIRPRVSSLSPVRNRAGNSRRVRSRSPTYVRPVNSRSGVSIPRESNVRNRESNVRNRESNVRNGYRRSNVRNGQSEVQSQNGYRRSNVRNGQSQNGYRRSNVRNGQSEVQSQNGYRRSNVRNGQSQNGYLISGSPERYQPRIISNRDQNMTNFNRRQISQYV